MKLSRSRQMKSTIQIIDETFEQRQWLRKHGKKEHITFDQSMLHKLQKYFVALDEDGSNSVSSNQLEDPLILFGMCQNKQQVEEFFRTLDVDGSGEMEFKEFLHIFRQVALQKKQRKLCRENKDIRSYEDFTKLLTGMKGKVENNLPLRLGMSVYRRKHLINAIMGKSDRSKTEGKLIMNKFQQQVSSNPEFKTKLLNPKNITQDFIPTLPKKKVILERIKKRIKTIF